MHIISVSVYCEWTYLYIEQEFTHNQAKVKVNSSTDRILLLNFEKSPIVQKIQKAGIKSNVH